MWLLRFWKFNSSYYGNESMINVIIAVFLVYLPIFGLILFYLTKVNKKYSIDRNSVSSLAKLEYPFNYIFNLSVGLYGALSLGSVVKFVTNFNSLLSISVFFFYICVGIGTLLVGVFPMNENSRMHKIVSVFLFYSLLILGVLSTLLFLLNSMFAIISLISAVVLIFTLILIWKTRDMNDESKYSKFEWIVFIGTIIWNFLFSMIVLAI